MILLQLQLDATVGVQIPGDHAELQLINTGQVDSHYLRHHRIHGGEFKGAGDRRAPPHLFQLNPCQRLCLGSAVDVVELHILDALAAIFVDVLRYADAGKIGVVVVLFRLSVLPGDRVDTVLQRNRHPDRQILNTLGQLQRTRRRSIIRTGTGTP